MSLTKKEKEKKTPDQPLKSDKSTIHTQSKNNNRNTDTAAYIEVKIE